MNENLIDHQENENELINIEEPKDDNLNKIYTIKTLNSEENNQNLNINNLEKKFSLKSENSLSYIKFLLFSYSMSFLLLLIRL